MTDWRIYSFECNPAQRKQLMQLANADNPTPLHLPPGTSDLKVLNQFKSHLPFLQSMKPRKSKVLISIVDPHQDQDAMDSTIQMHQNVDEPYDAAAIERHVKTQLDMLFARIEQNEDLSEQLKDGVVFRQYLKDWFTFHVQWSQRTGKSPLPTLDKLMDTIYFNERIDNFLGKIEHPTDELKLALFVSFFTATGKTNVDTDPNSATKALETAKKIVGFSTHPGTYPAQWNEAFDVLYEGGTTEDLNGYCLGYYPDWASDARGICMFLVTLL
jgi:hypothetical protein